MIISSHKTRSEDLNDELAEAYERIERQDERIADLRDANDRARVLIAQLTSVIAKLEAKND